MLHALRWLTLCLILLAGGPAPAETKPFAREDMASDAVRLTETLRVAAAANGAAVKGKTAQQLLVEAARARSFTSSSGPRRLPARRSPAAPKDPANWLAYAGIAAAALTTPRQTTATNRRRRARRRPTRRTSIRRRQSSGRGARRFRRSARPPRAMAAGARRLASLAGSPGSGRRAQDLRDDAGGARLPHPRLQGRFRRGRARAPASTSPKRWRAKTDFAPFVAVSGSARMPRSGRGPAALRRRAEARRALRHRAAPGPAVRVGESLLEVRRLRDLRPRPRPAGALHRPQLRPAAHGPGGRAAGLGQHAEGRRRDATASATAACCRRCARRISWASSSGVHRQEIASREGVKVWNGTLDTAKPS